MTVHFPEAMQHNATQLNPIPVPWNGTTRELITLRHQHNH